MSQPTSSFAIDVPDTLLARLRQGDRAAFEQIYRWFERPVFTLAMRMCGDREQAAEVLQDTMLKVIDRIGDFRGHNVRGDNARGHDAQTGASAGGENRSPFWGWLRQIAINEALMALRRNRRGGEWLDIADGPEPIDDITPPPAAAADAARLQRALEALPPTTRAVLWLYHAEGYTHEEIAELMQRTPSFSKSQLARGSRRLRALLEPEALPLPVVAEVAHG
jgi:RNA polymerase sigma factor (sigma-70 family)